MDDLIKIENVCVLSKTTSDGYDQFDYVILGVFLTLELAQDLCHKYIFEDILKMNNQKKSRCLEFLENLQDLYPELVDLSDDEFIASVMRKTGSIQYKNSIWRLTMIPFYS